MIPLLWAACRLAGPEPEVPLDVAALDVVTTLDLAVDRATRGDPLASESWTLAHERFEADIEPALRGRLSPEELLAIEYGFARVRSEMDRGQPSAELEALAERLREATTSPLTLAHR